MWRRVGAVLGCAAWLLLACGKSEQGPESSDDSAGSSTAGVTAASSGAANRAGAAVSAGGAGAQAGAASTGGDMANPGGQAEAGTTAVGGEASTGGAASCGGGYRACGCGCCVGQTSSLACVYPERGDDLATIIAADVARKNDLQGCSAAGCSLGIDYVCCEAPAPTPEYATYSSSLVIGGIDRISIDKTTANCSTLTLRQGSSSTPAPPAFAVDMPAGWQIQNATRLPCTSSFTKPLAIGALGTISLRVLDDTCVADVHLALFFSDDAHAVDAERFDIDGLAIDLPLASCH